MAKMRNCILPLNSASVSERCWSTIAKLVWSTPNIAKSQAVVQQRVSAFAMHHFTLKVLHFCQRFVHLLLCIYPSVRSRLYIKRVYISIQARWIILRKTCRSFHTYAFFSPLLALLFYHFHSFSVSHSHLLGADRTSQVSSATRESFTTRAKQQLISSLYGLWNWLKTGPAAFWVGERHSGNSPRAGGEKGWTVSRSGFRISRTRQWQWIAK